MLALLAALGVAFYGAAALVTVADILGRTIGLPIDGVVDLVQLFVLSGAWLVMPYAFMTGAHVGVDFVVAALPRPAAVALRAFAAVVAVALLALMLWHGTATFQTRTMLGDRSQQLGIPIAYYWYPLLIGLALSSVGALLGLASGQQQGHADV